MLSLQTKNYRLEPEWFFAYLFFTICSVLWFYNLLAISDHFLPFSRIKETMNLSSVNRHSPLHTWWNTFSCWGPNDWAISHGIASQFERIFYRLAQTIFERFHSICCFLVLPFFNLNLPDDPIQNSGLFFLPLPFSSLLLADQLETLIFQNALFFIKERG